MVDAVGVQAAADLFRVLGTASRLRLLQLLVDGPLAVGSLVERSGLSQPLVSQHLRTLRQAGLVSVERSGRTAAYALADHHVGHVIEDAIAHVLEPRTEGEGTDMTDATDTHAEHSVADHQHGDACGHDAVQHDGHVDYVHDEHRHALHGDHYDEH